MNDMSIKQRDLWLQVMQELAKSLEALGLSTLDGLTKKELRKVLLQYFYDISMMYYLVGATH